MTLDYDLALLVGGSVALGLRTLAGGIDWWTSDMRRVLPFSYAGARERLPRTNSPTWRPGWTDFTATVLASSLTRLSWLCLGITTLVSRPLELAS